MSKRSQQIKLNEQIKKKILAKTPIDEQKKAALKVLQFKVKGYNKKLILLRQHKIKKDTYLTILVKKVHQQFPTLSISQVYEISLQTMKYIFTLPKYGLTLFGQTQLAKQIMIQLQRFQPLANFVYNCVYYLRLSGLKMKFLWDTLNHYLLLMYLVKTFWKEKFIAIFGLSLLSYSFYFRETYFINYKTHTIWLQQLAQKYDLKVRDVAKDAVKTHVFANEELPVKVAPMLVDLVKQPKIKNLMTDLFIIMLKNKGFKEDTDRLITKVVHDYLNSKHCQEKFTKLLVEQVLKNEETILPKIYRLLKNYLLGDSREGLTKQSEDILINILKINGVARTAIDQMVRESQNALDKEGVYNAALGSAFNSLGLNKDQKK